MYGWLFAYTIESVLMSYFREHLNIMTSEEQALRAQGNQEMRYTIIIMMQHQKDVAGNQHHYHRHE